MDALTNILFFILLLGVITVAFCIYKCLTISNQDAKSKTQKEQQAEGCHEMPRNEKARNVSKKRKITLFNKFEVGIYTVILMSLFLAVLGGIKSVLTGNWSLLDFILYLGIWTFLFVLPIRYRLGKIFSLSSKKIISDDVLLWLSIIVIVFCGLQVGDFVETFISVLGLLFLGYIVPKIV